MKNIFCALICASLFLSSTNANADITLSTSGNPNSALADVTFSDWIATQFGVDNSDYELDQITLSLVLPDVETATGIVGEIRADDGFGMPGSLVSTMFAFPSSITSGPVTFFDTDEFLNPNNTILSANTDYFFVVGSSTGNTFQVAISTVTTADPGSIWSIGNGYLDSGDGGSNWTPQSTFQARFEISATAVPEPSFFMLLSISGAGLLFVRRR